MYLTNLAKAARRSGLIVVEVPGWQTRGRPASSGPFNPTGVGMHHTGSTSDSTSILINGRSDLPGPLCQLGLTHDCKVQVIAAGRANHGGVTDGEGWTYQGDANSQILGIEAHNSGSEGWESKGKDASGKTITQKEAYWRLVAALCDFYGWPRHRVLGHGEWSVTGKWDPGARPGVMVDMDEWRKQIAAVRLPGAKPWPQYGETGKLVREAQTRLNKMPSTKPKLQVDGDFGPKTKAAALAFEQAHAKSHGLKADGKFGKLSWELLKELTSPKAQGSPK